MALFRKKYRYPALIPVQDSIRENIRYITPECMKKLNSRLDSFLNCLYKKVGMDEFSVEDLDIFWASVNEMILADLENQKRDHETRIESYMERAAMESHLLKKMRPSIEQELLRLESELKILNENTYKWAFVKKEGGGL